MKYFRYILTLAVVVLMPLAAIAQMTDKVEVKQITDKYDLGLTKRPSLPFFDLSRFHMTQSYSIGFFSGGGWSGTRGLYNNTITYQLANPLRLTLSMGILHDPSSLWGDKRSSNATTFLPSGWLDWRPSDNFRMLVGFETIPGNYYNGYYGYGYNGYYGMGRYDPWRW
jgi:hypothetical protein